MPLCGVGDKFVCSNVVVELVAGHFSSVRSFQCEVATRRDIAK